MKHLCDLHTHSVFSDGTLTPTQLVEQAEALGLGAVALTDHNTVSGLPELIQAARGKSVKAVPGVEFSVDYLDQELHILALYIKPEHYPAAQTIINHLDENKRLSNLDLAENLNRAGYHISYEKIKASMPGGEPNRALFAKELTELGYAANNDDAFKRILHPKHGFYHPPKRIDTFELIEFVRNLGAVPVWAHAFLHLQQEDQIRTFLPRALEAGLVGMEVQYPKFSPEQTDLAAALAKEYALLPSGGSDFHGTNKPEISLGTGMDNLAVPLAWCQALEQAAK